MANLPPAISASRLYRDFGRVQAVAGVDLTVAPGEIYAFIGPNGAGKTTTLRILRTLLLPTSGQAFGPVTMWSPMPAWNCCGCRGALRALAPRNRPADWRT